MRITVLALVLGLAMAPVAVAQAAPAGKPFSVTLITGDRVLLDGDRVVSYLPGKGRDRLVVHTYTSEGHRYVVPADAAPLIDSGKLDRRLFDVTALAGRAAWTPRATRPR